MSVPGPAGRGRPLRRGRGLLDRQAIVAAALAVARTEGLPAVTMRRIADELGCAPMSLYRHVADRDALVLEMLDVVAAGIDVPPPSSDPREELTGLLTAVHAALAVDHWAVLPLVAEGMSSPRILPVLDRVLAALTRSGFTGRSRLAVHQMLWQYLFGELLWTHHDQPDSHGKRMVRGAPPEDFPAIADAVRTASVHPAENFTDNLQRLLDGVLGGPAQR
ncbi:TetR family transcriptional regulator [Pseudonocardia hierapolitana]|uniref:TetR family transcriptional regulator n=1 Tax=Pseudonocardia hierapolitana TaxID=1128676 RepID=A0A561T0Y0_9PSEU|nr:TetR/AcrR family transcriptional regulator [Pseudonocardia hierapolitana]TWF80772.1 TetR family transcriptional regulator [Pseudonocardia hierapolitana]